MIWLLDTNTLVHALNGVRSVCARLNQVPPQDRVVTSVLAVAELMYGVEASTRREANLRRVEKQLALVEVVPVSDAAARLFGRIKAGLRAKAWRRVTSTCSSRRARSNSTRPW